ncbi:MAG: SDR family NAD(P)-dependent oxidoreductase [Pseudomonadota bacterium]
MSNTALITGASSGIGAEFARYHAEKGGDVILVARRKPALDTLKKELEAAHKIKATVIAMDLGSAAAAKKLHNTVTAKKLDVDILINNAGFGGHGDFVDRDLDDDLAMIDLNVDALVTLANLFGKDMVAKGSGKMLHVGSTAGFMPGPKQATYFATKAFVNSFSQALDQEFQGTGVTSSVLVPGYVETEFAKAASLEGTGLVSGGGKTASSCARIGYDGMMRGKLVIFNELGLSIMLGWLMPFLPRRMALRMVEKMQTK